MAWNISMPKAHWVTQDHPSLQAIINEVTATKEIAIDTETTGKDDMIRDHALYWSLSWGENRYCLPVSTLPYFTDAFRNPDKNWIFVNAKFDMHMVANLGVEFAGHIIDTSVMHALLYEERPHGLEFMSKELLGWTWKEGGFKTQVDMQKVRGEDGKKVWESAGDALRRLEQNDLKRLVDYASNDAYGTFKIYKVLKKELENTYVWSLWPAVWETMWDVFWYSEVPFTTVLWNCEREGIRVNRGYLEGLSGPMQKELADMERQMAQIAAVETPELFNGRIFNPRSTDHVRDYFFDPKGKGYKPRMMTKGGKSGVRMPSVDKTVLEYFDEKGDGMARILRPYRKLDDFHSDYIKGLPKKLDHHDRAHTRFNQDIARTGRLSSSNPNLQNIKRADEDPYRVRGAFIPEPGNTFIVADYEQLEMRLLACASMEPKMIDIFARGWDIHMGNAALVFGKKHGVKYEDIVSAKKLEKKVKNGELPSNAMTQIAALCLVLRQRAKSIGFGLNYGMKENKLARQIGVSIDEAKQLITEYLATYPAVNGFYEDAINRAYESGYSFTLNGKRRFLPEIRSNNQMDAWTAERQAVNNEIQGTAANAAQWAMINIFRQNLKKQYDCRMLLQVHDELVFECPEEAAPEVMPIIQEIMEHPFLTDLPVHLAVSIGKGPNWADAK
jgi:DNA polymerase-1